ncbi:MAG: transcriptional repressor [Lachnospiraceae bacterium]|jgi:Fur family peroxide stress response transcriptional regulator|nr:transcriptional repressor [Lachnospiraceae bacterium]
MKSLKYSRQREGIKEFLRHRTDHPTADTVYMNIRQIYPNISLGTVYRNLSLLAGQGEIQKIACEGADRFDAVTAPHYHVICRRCGRVDDLPMAWETESDDLASRHYAGRIEGHTTCFHGLCPSCAEAEDAGKSQPCSG